MKIVLREIGMNDARPVLLLSKQLGYNISLHELEANITIIQQQNDNMVFVALYNNKVVGWIGVALILIVQLPLSVKYVAW